MDSRIGTILREARRRRSLEIAEIERATRIRARFLRAIENEEWDVLPGGVYTRSFIRTYASFVGLDGERLAEDFRREVEGAAGRRGPSQELAPVAASTATGSPGGRRSFSYLGWLAVPAVILVGVVAIVAIPGGGGGDSGAEQPRHAQHAKGEATAKQEPSQRPGTVSLRLVADAEVWVCLLDRGERPLIEGEILAAGAEEGPFRSAGFSVSFGNGAVRLMVDGEQAEIPSTSSPIGYAIDSSGRLTELSEAERPTCA